MKIKITSDDDQDFDFSNFPRLGRPLLGGSGRVKYIKFYVSVEELELIDKKFNNVLKFCKDNDLHFNRPDFLRFLVSHADHPQILKLFYQSLTTPD